METIDIILKSLILISFVICAIGLYKVSATIHDYLWYVQTEKDKDRKIPIDGLWKKIWQDAEPKEHNIFNFPKDWELLKTELKAEKAKNEILTNENKTYQDLVEKLKDDKKEYIKDLEGKVYSGNYKCGSLKEQLPYPCNVLKAVTDCA